MLLRQLASKLDVDEWLKERLRKKKEKYNEIMPDFRIATQSLRKGDTMPELQDIHSMKALHQTLMKLKTEKHCVPKYY